MVWDSVNLLYAIISSKFMSQPEEAPAVEAMHSTFRMNAERRRPLNWEPRANHDPTKSN